VNNRIRLEVTHQFVDHLAIGNGVNHHLEIGMIFKMLSAACGKIVNGDDLITSFQQHFYNVRADLTQAACDDDFFHKFSFELMFGCKPLAQDGR
jgi:hypothetical protein